MKGKGKKLAAFVLALGLLLSLCAGALAEEYGVVINTDTLNLRSQGSSSSAWLGQYNRGTWVQIIGSQNNFYRVVTPDGKSGYMSKNYISITGGGYMTSRVAMVTNQNGGAFLNFRAQPSYNAQVLGIFYYGVPLLVTGQTNGWYQVQINGQTGYVRSEYVTVRDQIASSTVATIKTPGNTAMNLRSGPGLQYDVIQQFSGDRYVMVLAQGAPRSKEKHKSPRGRSHRRGREHSPIMPQRCRGRPVCRLHRPSCTSKTSCPAMETASPAVSARRTVLRRLGCRSPYRVKSPQSPKDNQPTQTPPCP